MLHKKRANKAWCVLKSHCLLTGRVLVREAKQQLIYKMIPGRLFFARFLACLGFPFDYTIHVYLPAKTQIYMIGVS